MDYNLLEDFSSKFKEIHDNEMNEDFEEFDPLSEPQIKIRLMEAIEKLRHDLTSNTESDVRIDELMFGEDFCLDMFDRDQFEQVNS